MLLTCYLFNGIHLHFHLCIMEIPANLRNVFAYDSITQPGDLDL